MCISLSISHSITRNQTDCAISWRRSLDHRLTWGLLRLIFSTLANSLVRWGYYELRGIRGLCLRGLLGLAFFIGVGVGLHLLEHPHLVVLPDMVHGPTGPLHIEKLKVLYNNSTQKYVTWMIIDNDIRELGMALVDVSDYPNGPFEFLRSLYPDGNQTRDQTVFQDDDVARPTCYGVTTILWSMSFQRLSCNQLGKVSRMPTGAQTLHSAFIGRSMSRATMTTMISTCNDGEQRTNLGKKFV